MTCAPTPTRTTLLPILLTLCSLPTLAQDTPPGIVGKDGWLFYRHEFAEDPKGADISVDLIQRISRLLTAQGTAVTVALAPLKARVYAEHLPAGLTLSPAQLGQHDRLLAKLRDAGVLTVDLNKAFVQSPKRVGEFPLFIRQDTHWSAPGALVAAEAIRDAVLSTPALKAAYEATPAAPYSLTWSTQKWPVEGDLIQQLPKGAPKQEKEMVSVFEVKRTQQAASLLGNAPHIGVTLMGSSYSADWTQFPAALKYTLQRDTLSISVAADQGQWVGLESYLRDDAFQNNRPKLLIWELPERDVKSPPDMPYREARYVMDNTEWLLRAAAWVQAGCKTSTNTVQIEATSLGSKKTGSEVSVPGSEESDYLELSFARPVDKLDYLAAQLTSHGSKTLTLEATGPGVTTRKFTLSVAGDEHAHVFKTPLWTKSAGYTKLKIYPGKTRGFSLKTPQLCQQPADLLS